MLTKADMNMVQEIREIMQNGMMDEDPRPHYSDGSPAHTKFITQTMYKYNLDRDEFPILTLRPIAWKGAIREVLAIYQLASNKLADVGHIWDNWAIGDGETIGPVYGETVRRYDLMGKLLNGIKNNPYGRRHMISLWQEPELEEAKKVGALMPCAFLTMFSVSGKYLDMTLIQRSGDSLTASGPGGWNEVQYAAFLMMVARHTGYKPRNFVHFVQNEQIYDRHFDQAKELEKRYEKQCPRDFHNLNPEPKVRLILNSRAKNFYKMTVDDFTIENYNPIKPQLKMDIGI